MEFLRRLLIHIALFGMGHTSCLLHPEGQTNVLRKKRNKETKVYKNIELVETLLTSTNCFGVVRFLRINLFLHFALADLIYYRKLSVKSSPTCFNTLSTKQRVNKC